MTAASQRLRKYAFCYECSACRDERDSMTFGTDCEGSDPTTETPCTCSCHQLLTAEAQLVIPCTRCQRARTDVAERTQWRMTWNDGAPPSVTSVRQQMQLWIRSTEGDPRLEAVERSDDGGETWYEPEAN